MVKRDIGKPDIAELARILGCPLPKRWTTRLGWNLVLERAHALRNPELPYGGTPAKGTGVMVSFEAWEKIRAALEPSGVDPTPWAIPADVP